MAHILSGFHNNLARFLHQLALDTRNPRVWIFNSIRITYPSWLEQDLAVATPTIRRRDLPPGFETPSSSDLMTSTQINANSFFRHDTVLVKFESTASRTLRINTMSRRRVVQVLLFFKCRHNGKTEELAYVNWFKTIQMASDTSCGMYLVKRTSKRSVIPVRDIERPVHLMPKFGSQLGAAAQAKKAMDEAKERDRAWRHQTNYQGTKTWNMTDFILEYYSEFWLNVWSDRHIYKSIY